MDMHVIASIIICQESKEKRTEPGSLPETVDFWCRSKRRTTARLLFYDAGAA